MREPVGRMLGLSATLLLCVLATTPGCNSVAPNQSSHLAGKGVVVRPGMELQWACKSPADQPGMVRSGTSVVGPDGTIVMGPYGACAVAGLTLDQASSRVEKQLAPHVKQPHVTLTLAQAADQIVWSKAMPGDAIRHVGGTQPHVMPKGTARDEPLPLLAHPGVVIAQPTALAMRQHGKPHHHGKPMLALPNAPNEMNPVLLPEYVIRPPDVLVIETIKGLQTDTPKGPVPLQPIRGAHLVRPDGTVSIGIYGPAMVAGKTVAEARKEVAKTIFARLNQMKPELEKDVHDNLSLDVLTYNSAVYYVITDGAGQGEQVARFAVTGNETVLDAISQINGLSPVSSPRRIWVARRNPGNAMDSIYPVDWKGIAMQGSMATNWQIMPGDRVYVQADPMRRFNVNLQKFLEPIERVMGGVLLGSQTVNSIRTGTTGFR